MTTTTSRFTRRQFLQLAVIVAGIYTVGPLLGVNGGATTGPVKPPALLPHSPISAFLSGGIAEAVKMRLANRIVAFALGNARLDAGAPESARLESGFR